jgi:hypothetical protein
MESDNLSIDQRKVNSSQETSNASPTSRQTEIIVEVLPKTRLERKFVNDFLVRPLQTSDRNWVVAFIKSHLGSEIVVAKCRVMHPAGLDGFAAFEADHTVGLLTYKIEGLDCESSQLTAPLKARESELRSSMLLRKQPKRKAVEDSG